MRGRVLGLALAGVATAFLSPPVTAQEAKAAPTVVQSPILMVDLDKLFSETLFGKAVNDRYKTEGDALVSENLRLETALEAEERDLTDRRAVLPAAEFKSLASAFDVKTEQIRSAQEAKARAISARRESEQQRFIDAAKPVLGALMRDSGAAAIFDKNMVFLSFRGIDITDTAIARIDAVLGTGDGPPTQEPLPEPKPQP